MKTKSIPSEHAALLAQVSELTSTVALQNEMIEGARKAASRLMVENSALLAVAEAAQAEVENRICDPAKWASMYRNNPKIDAPLLKLYDSLAALAALREGKVARVGDEAQEGPDPELAIVHGENCGCKSFDDCPSR